MLKKENIKDIYRLSPMQEGMFFHYLEDPASPAYFEQLSYRLKGELDIAVAEKAINYLVARYDILRVVFNHEKADEPLQIVLKERKADFSYRDIRSVPDTEQYVADFKEADRKSVFDLQKDILLRVSVLQVSADEYEFILSHHHILMDGWCMGILFSEYLQVYESYRQNKPVSLPAVKQYGDYLSWLSRLDENKSLAYWKNYLGEYSETATLPRIAGAQPNAHYVHACETLRIGKSQTLALRSLAAKTGVTLNTLVQAVWGILLGRYNNRTDVVFGSVVSGRPAEIDGVEDMLGLFINTIPVRIRYEEHSTIEELLRSVQQRAIESEAFHYTSLAAVQGQSELKHALLDHIIVFRNHPVLTANDEVPGTGEAAKPVLAITGTDAFEQTNYHFNISVEPYEDKIEIEFRYNAAVYANEMVGRLSGHFQRILGQVAENSNRKLGEIELLSPNEKQELLETFNDTQADFPSDTTICRMFEKQAMRSPDQPAVIFGGTSLSYAELDQLSSQLAGLLLEKGVQPDDVVALLTERSLEMVIGIFGILKAGAAYLPIDPANPAERKDYILRDSQARLLLVHAQEYIPQDGGPEVIDIGNRNLYSGKSPATRSVAQPRSLAYVIYTSGSTGMPKGAMIEHHSLVNRLHWMRKAYPVGAGDAILQKTPYTFDVSVWELLLWSITGSTLVMLQPGGEKEPDQIISAIKAHNISMMHFVPSMLKAFLKYADEFGRAEELASLKFVVCSGEALNPEETELFGSLVTDAHGTRLSNLYGPTEATIDVSYYECEPGKTAKTIPIGKPIDNTRLLVLDKADRLVPIGVPGELHLAGVGLARGYLNNPGLTAGKFVPDPFHSGERMYRTGDLARWLPDGNVEYLGRLDDQVKIRGYRIELGEIESKLKQFPGVKDAVAAVHGTGDEKKLCAYYIADQVADEKLLQEFLLGLLPAYMVPAHFMRIAEIPLSRNGKLNKKALPAFEAARAQFIAPRNPIEQKLAECWAQVLNLDIEKIGVNDNYFSMGGDSIKAIRLLTRIAKATGRKLRVHELFTNPTIATLAGLITSESDSESAEKTEEVNRRLARLKQEVLDKSPDPSSIDDVYPMSDIQKGMVFYALKESEQSIYHDQFIYHRIFTKFDQFLFARALTLMVEKHAVMRTIFNLGDYSEPVQLVVKNIPVILGFEDLSSISGEEQTTIIRRAIDDDRKKGFGEPGQPLWRMKIFNTGADHYVFLWSFHHAILDGWSNASFMTELNNTYLGLKNEIGYLPETLKSSYRDFVVHTLAENKAHASAFWKKELSEYARITFDGLGDPQAPPRKEVIKKVISASLLKKTEAECERRGISLKHFCFGAYLYALYLSSPKADLLTGLVSNLRPLIEDGDKIIGCFLNTVPVRVSIPRNTDWSAYAGWIDQKLLELKKYDRLSLHEIAEATGEKSGNGNPFFDTIFNYVDFHIYDSLDGNEEQTQAPASSALNDISGFENTNTLFDFSVMAGNNGLEYEVIYSPRLVSRENTERIMDWFATVLEKMTLAGNEPARKESIIGGAEKKLLLELNSTAADFPSQETLHGVFSGQCSFAPANAAIIADGIVLSYADVDNESSKLAKLLLQKGISRGNFTGICMERSPRMIISILAVLKAGSAYVPLSPDYPLERKRFMLEDSGAKLVLADGKADLKTNDAFEVFDVSQWENEGKETSEWNFPGVEPSDPAYVIYTSGSTGKPKGVIVSHENVTNLAFAQKKQFGITPDERILQFTTITFDASVEQIWLAFFSGAALVLVNKELLNDPDRFADYLMANKVTHLHAVPSFLRTVRAEKISGLRRVISGGDTCLAELAETWLSTCSFYNEYGPTETTVTSIEYKAELPAGTAAQLPIGKPIANTQVYILDENGMQQPVGIAGELFIGGKGVARGYLNNEALTREKFRPDPYSKGGRLYKTGDMVRLRKDGNLEFLGRTDEQVKIRGYRIELGEIENCLRGLNGVKDAVIIAQSSGGEKLICAYYVSVNGEDINTLRTMLASRLPDYMVPAWIIRIDRIPLLHNGKTDRKSLPEPGAAGQQATAAAFSEQERKLRTLWSEALHLPEEHIGPDDNFFDRGGHSLLVAVLASRIHKAFNIPVSVPDFFRAPTIRGLAALLRKSAPVNYGAISPAAKKASYPVSSVQKRLFVLQQFNPQGTVYNIPMEFPIGKNADRELIALTLRQLISRHESLRTSFILQEDPVQVIHDHVELELESLSGDAAGFEALREKFIRPFDLAKAPLLRAAHVRLSDAADYLLLDMHHLVTDAVSHEVLKREFLALYAGNTLEAPRLQYKDYSEWLNAPEQQSRIRLQESFWLDLFQGEIPVLELPTDFHRPPFQDFEGAVTRFAFTNEELEKLKALTAANGTTAYMNLFSLLAILLAKLGSKDDLIIGVPVAARRHADLENIVGMFVNTLALRSFPAGNKTFGAFLRETRENTIQAFEHQEYSFEDLVEKLALQREAARNPLFDVMFNLVNDDSLSVEANAYGRHERTRSKFDLSFTATVSSEATVMDVVYSTALFKPSTIDRFIRYFRQIIAQAGEDKTIGEIELLTAQEKEAQLHVLNDTGQDFGVPKTVHALFAGQVALEPEKIAICSGDEKLTYRALNERAEYWAVKMKKSGIGRNDRVALLFDHSPAMIVSMLAVMKAGAAFLPINPDLPRNMISYILEDSGAKLLLANRDDEYEAVMTWRPGNETLATGMEPESGANASDPVYIIYTSGTTGRPKGVIVRHENVFNYLHWFKQEARLTGRDKTVLATSYAYDLGYTALFSALAWGCELHLLGKEAYSSAEQLADYLAENRITYLKLTPSIYSYLKNAKGFSRVLKELRLVVLGGEKINPEDVLETLAMNDAVNFINHYGPTEATIGCITCAVNKHNAERFAARPVIGLPIANVQAYILDGDGKLLPEGVTGEICIAGKGLATGYLHNEELTRAKFTGHPFTPGNRIYRTGDLGRITNGAIEFLGRTDHQVKLRGYRVEVQEIENNILRLEDVSQCHVAVYGSAPDHYLAVYYTGQPSATEEKLRDFLQKELPAYMIPQFFTRLESIPFNRNGKVDRTQLPEPVFKPAEFIPLDGQTQQQLAVAWSELLGVPLAEIGANADFFSSGGHSLKAMRLSSSIRKTFGVEITILEIFTLATLEAIARRIDSLSEGSDDILLSELENMSQEELDSLLGE